jgi:D-alanine-D-alanine ligase
VPEAIGNEVRRLTVETFRVTQSLDLSRVDFRLDTGDNLRPCVLEINSLPGITPISDLTECARADGWTYEQLINAVLDAAVRRWGLDAAGTPDRQAEPSATRRRHEPERAREAVPT